MAMSCMIRKASSHIPLAVRAVASSSYPGLLFRKAIEHNKTFSTVVDDPNLEEIKILDKQLNQILESRINELILPRSFPPKPANFPFTIEDHPKDVANITLKREIGNEKIEINVDMPHIRHLPKSEINNDNDRSKEFDDSLNIKVWRENGSSLTFTVDKAFEKEFKITHIYVYPAGLEDKYNEDTYNKNNFVKELGWDVQEFSVLKRYVEMKFIKDIDYGFLKKYMTINKRNKDAREQLYTLSQLKQFVKGSINVDSEQEDQVVVEKQLANELQHNKKNFVFVDSNSEIKILEKQLNEILTSRLKTAQLLKPAKPPIPDNFPFMIEEDRRNYIILKREIGSEKIKILHMPCLVGHDTIYFTVTRENEIALTFKVNAFEKAEYEISGIYVHEGGRWLQFHPQEYLDVQGMKSRHVDEALKKYLEVRGMKEIDCEFLNKYYQESIAHEKLFLLTQFKHFVDAEQTIE